MCLRPLAFTIDHNRLPEFFILLQQGFGVRVQAGSTLEELLCNQWCLDPEYVRNRITTIFFNSRAIDNVANAFVRDGSVIALSGAMPGLVGATMRRGGYYAAMRGAMTYHEQPAEAEKKPASIRVKLFNLLLPELGPGFLQRGILLDGAQLRSFLSERDDAFWQGCRCSIPEKAPSNRALADAWANSDEILLTVEAVTTP